jgi:hypothetical protein
MEIVLELALPLCIRHTTKILVNGMLLLKIVVIFRQSVKGQREVVKLKRENQISPNFSILPLGRLELGILRSH